MSVPTLSRMKLTKLSWILPVQGVISNLAVGLQILCFQSSLSFKSITYMDPCFVSEFVTTYLGHIFLKIDSGTVGEINVLCAPRRSNIHPEPFSSCRVNLITWFLFYLNFFCRDRLAHSFQTLELIQCQSADLNSDVANWNWALITCASFMLAQFCPPLSPHSADSVLTPYLLGWDLEWDPLKHAWTLISACVCWGWKLRQVFHHRCRPTLSPNHQETVAD